LIVKRQPYGPPSMVPPTCAEVSDHMSRRSAIRSSDRVRPQPAVERAGKLAVGTAALLRDLTDELRTQFGQCGHWVIAPQGPLYIAARSLDNSLPQMTAFRPRQRTEGVKRCSTSAHVCERVSLRRRMSAGVGQRSREETAECTAAAMGIWSGRAARLITR
jgi:hypothetical protein